MDMMMNNFSSRQKEPEAEDLRCLPGHTSPVPAGRPVSRSQVTHTQLVGQATVERAVQTQTAEELPADTQRSVSLSVQQMER